MITVPLIYNAATRELSTTAEWIGYTIDNLSVKFTITGIPDGYKAKLEYDVTINDSRGNQIHPYDHVNMSAGVGYVNLKAVVIRACRRDARLPIQLILTDRTTGEIIASTQVRFNIDPAIAAYDSQQSTLPFIDQAVAKIREDEIGFIEVTKLNGDTYTVKTGVTDFEDITNIPIVTEWGENPSDKNIPSEKLVKDTLELIVEELNGKTPKTMAIPDWDITAVYNAGSAVIYNYAIYISIQENNLGHDPTEEDSSWWTIVKGGGGGGSGGMEEHEIGDGMSTYIEVAHGLNTTQLLWNLRRKSDGEFVDTKVFARDNNTVILYFAQPPAENSLLLLLASAGGGSSGGGAWGEITGNIERQLDLKAKLDKFATNYTSDTDPTEDTPGKAGDLWINWRTGATYALVYIEVTPDKTIYHWELPRLTSLDDEVTEDSENGVKSSGIFAYAQPRMKSGTNNPSDSEGNDGDFYIKRGV